MQCVILAAGEGKRMRPLTAHRPKVLLPIGNRPILEHLVCAARDAGATGLVLVVGYGEDEVREHFGDGTRFGIPVTYRTQRRQRGTADALSAAKDAIHGPFILMNGDMLMDTADIAAISAISPPAVGIHHSDHPWDYGTVTVLGGKVESLVEKSASPPGNLINAGIYHLDPSIFPVIDTLPPSPRGELELTDALAGAIRAGRLSAREVASWMDAGYPWDLLEANEACLSRIVPAIEGSVEEGVVLSGPVRIGEGTVVKAGSYIEGPCLIGKNCRIGPHAYIRGSTAIGDGCHIGHATEIKNSVIMDGTKLPHFNYAGDSVIGRRCNFGAGTKIANLRHDHGEVKAGGTPTRRVKFGAVIGDDVLFGINCSVNVGAVVGSGCRIAPHTFVEGEIAGGSVLR